MWYVCVTFLARFCRVEFVEFVVCVFGEILCLSFVVCRLSLFAGFCDIAEILAFVVFGTRFG